jgi:hypothetical protein
MVAPPVLPIVKFGFAPSGGGRRRRACSPEQRECSQSVIHRDLSESSGAAIGAAHRRHSRRTGAFGLAKWLIGGQRQMEYSVRSSAGPLSGFAGIIATGLAGTASTFPPFVGAMQLSERRACARSRVLGIDKPLQHECPELDNGQCACGNDVATWSVGRVLRNEVLSPAIARRSGLDGKLYTQAQRSVPVSRRGAGLGPRGPQ